MRAIVYTSVKNAILPSGDSVSTRWILGGAAGLIIIILVAWWFTVNTVSQALVPASSNESVVGSSDASITEQGRGASGEIINRESGENTLDVSGFTDLQESNDTANNGVRADDGSGEGSVDPGSTGGSLPRPDSGTGTVSGGSTGSPGSSSAGAVSEQSPAGSGGSSTGEETINPGSAGNENGATNQNGNTNSSAGSQPPSGETSTPNSDAGNTGNSNSTTTPDTEDPEAEPVFCTGPDGEIILLQHTESCG